MCSSDLGAAGVQHGGNQGGLAGVRVPDHNQIADVLAFVNLQSASFKGGARTRLAGDFESEAFYFGLLVVGQEGPGLQRDKISTN